MALKANRLFSTAVLVLAVWGCVDSLAQNRAVYKCVNSAGTVVFSDKVCQGKWSSVRNKAPTDAAMTQQKAEHDARISRDKQLATEVETGRLAREQEGRAAQNQQMQVNKALSGKVDSERAQRNSSVNSAPGINQSTPTTTVPTY